jgi:hypothetical protein
MNLRESLGILMAGALLLLLCLAGVGWIVVNREIFTVDGLFMALILLTIAGTIALELLLELRHKDTGQTAAGHAGAARAAAAASSGAAAAGTQTATGIVERVEFYEAPVGEPNKTLVSLRDGGGQPARLLTFEGNIQHRLTQGRRMRIVYRPGPLNVLVETDRA